MEGWIKLHRSLLDWGWFTEPNTLSVFIYLLLIARGESGIWHGISVEMGQAITSRDKIAKATGLSEQQVRTSLERLKSTNEITIKSTNKFTLVTITNYESYQSDNNYQQPANQPANQPTNNQQITNKQPTNNQQDSKEKKKKKGNISTPDKETQEFVDYIYNLYPSKCPKRDKYLGKNANDKVLILKLLTKYTKEQVEAGVKREIEDRYGKCYMRNFSTFLNNFPDPNVLVFSETPSDNNEVILKKMYETLAPEKEAEIYGLDPYEFSILPENAKRNYRDTYKDKLLKWFKDTQ